MKRSVGRVGSGVLAEYLGYIERLVPGEAGRLHLSAGERVGTVRMRLGADARSAGKPMLIRRVGGDLVFWLNDDAAATGLAPTATPRAGVRSC
ncbi:MAG: hypothetical protein FJ318_04925 [SAR202 cluster bacterium]|nr:hypothetical protein [SAR202 cluster bacterium]